MKVFHLSHTDLDGYGAQFITSRYFDDIVFFNSNYGREIDQRIEQITALAQKGDCILITDLNLSLVQCKKLDEFCKEKEVKITLLDHHISALECVGEYEWYFLDTQRSASAITFDFFSSIFGDKKGLEKITKVINSVDIWKSDEEEFELGKVLLAAVATAKEINKIMFDKEHRDYIFHILNSSMSFFNEEEAHIKLDEKLYFIKKEFFKRDKNDSFGNLISNYIVLLLSNQKEKFSIDYNGHRGILTYNIGNTSVIGNDFLRANRDFDFFMDINSKKGVSIRADDGLDVSVMAAKLFGGGGHKNASGGVFLQFKDGFLYEEIKKQLQDNINLKVKEENSDEKK